jgi:hypothetical protein
MTMLSTINLAREEEIERSKEIVKELKDPNIANEKLNELMSELERMTGNVRRKIIDELLRDVNSLEPFFRGSLKKKLVENYEVEVENLEKVERWKWSIEVVGGRKVMFDPYAENPKYEEIPMMKIERSRNVFICSTNRSQVAAIEKLLVDFLERARSLEFHYTSIDKIISEKLAVEVAIERREVVGGRIP